MKTNETQTKPQTTVGVLVAHDGHIFTCKVRDFSTKGISYDPWMMITNEYGEQTWQPRQFFLELLGGTFYAFGVAL